MKHRWNSKEDELLKRAAAEKEYILQRQQEIGNQWKKIAKEIKKTPNQVKNYFHGLHRQNNGINKINMLLLPGAKQLPIKFLALLEIAEQCYQEEMDCSD